MSNLNRRNFLQMIGIGTAAAIAAPIVSSPTAVPKVVPMKDFSRQPPTTKGSSTDTHNSYMFDNPHHVRKSDLMG